MKTTPELAPLSPKEAPLLLSCSSIRLVFSVIRFRTRVSTTPASFCNISCGLEDVPRFRNCLFIKSDHSSAGFLLMDGRIKHRGVRQKELYFSNGDSGAEDVVT
ncbi:hypothetical protein TNCV_2109461 [Trichonephila clavipes]|nr:hypothetical protein TNCV_2109461 [Trichonephila clavipes]